MDYRVWSVRLGNATITAPFKKVTDTTNSVALLTQRPLGLNHAASVIHTEPDIWTARRFLNGAFHGGSFVMLPRFVIGIKDAILDLDFVTGNVNRDNENHKSVIIECNIHHDVLHDLADLKTKISGWKEGRDVVYSTLISMLGAH